MVELVWDAERSATCTTAAGGVLTVGEHQWSPDDLLAGAVASSLMRTFLDLAHRLPLLGYVAVAEVSVPSLALEVPRIEVRLVVTVGPATSPDTVRALCEEARRRASIARLVSAPVRVRCDVEVLADARS